MKFCVVCTITLPVLLSISYENLSFVCTLDVDKINKESYFYEALYLISQNHSQINSKEYVSLELYIQNLRNRVNLIDNKSPAENILINNVEEKSTENVEQLIT